MNSKAVTVLGAPVLGGTESAVTGDALATCGACDAGTCGGDAGSSGGDTGGGGGNGFGTDGGTGTIIGSIIGTKSGARGDDGAEIPVFGPRRFSVGVGPGGSWRRIKRQRRRERRRRGKRGIKFLLERGTGEEREAGVAGWGDAKRVRIAVQSKDGLAGDWAPSKRRGYEVEFIFVLFCTHTIRHTLQTHHTHKYSNIHTQIEHTHCKGCARLSAR